MAVSDIIVRKCYIHHRAQQSSSMLIVDLLFGDAMSNTYKQHVDENCEESFGNYCITSIFFTRQRAIKIIRFLRVRLILMSVVHDERFVRGVWEFPTVATFLLSDLLCISKTHRDKREREVGIRFFSMTAHCGEQRSMCVTSSVSIETHSPETEKQANPTFLFARKYDRSLFFISESNNVVFFSDEK